jgi:hypothetical protein
MTDSPPTPGAADLAWVPHRLANLCHRLLGCIARMTNDL